MYSFKYIPNEKKVTDNFNITNLLKVKTAPTIPLPEEIVDTITLGDGTTSYRHTGVYKDREIEIECNFVRRSKEAWMDNFAAIKRCFKNGQGILYLLDDDSSHYFKVKSIDIDVNSRFHGKGSDFTLKFTCDPYRYVIKDARPYSLVTDKTIQLSNPHEKAYPIYRVYNTSTNANQISIFSNLNRMTISNPFEEYQTYHEERFKVVYFDINTEKQCMITHYKSYESDETVERYTTIKTSGSFEGLALSEGNNEVYVTVDVGALAIDILRNYREL